MCNDFDLKGDNLQQYCRSKFDLRQSSSNKNLILYIRRMGHNARFNKISQLLFLKSRSKQQYGST